MYLKKAGKVMREMGYLIKLLDLDDQFIVDLRYATSDNFTREKIYNSGVCYIHENTAKLLIKAKDIFLKNGYRVKIWDAYRPVRAQIKFWSVFPDNNFVGKPPETENMKEFKASHMNGLCVDITLTDMNGEEIEMPSQFDDFSSKASLSSPEISEEGRKNGEYLKKVMESVGFTAYENEWWHFYDKTIAAPPYADYQI